MLLKKYIYVFAYIVYSPTPAVSRASASEKPTRTRIPANTKTKQQHDTMVRRHFPSQFFNVRPRNKKPKLKRKGTARFMLFKKKKYGALETA